MSDLVSLPKLGFSLAAGGLTTLSPCVFPMLPLVVGGALQGNRLGPVAMGLGMVASFAGIGVVLGALGPALGVDGDTVRFAGAAMLTWVWRTNDLSSPQARQEFFRTGRLVLEKK